MWFTRNEYNTLVNAYPVFMAEVWARYAKSWSIGGVSLKVSATTYNMIRSLL